MRCVYLLQYVRSCRSWVDDEGHTIYAVLRFLRFLLAYNHHCDIIPQQLRIWELLATHLCREWRINLRAQNFQCDACFGSDAESDLAVNKHGVGHELLWKEFSISISWLYMMNPSLPWIRDRHRARARPDHPQGRSPTRTTSSNAFHRKLTSMRIGCRAFDSHQREITKVVYPEVPCFSPEIDRRRMKWC